MIITAEIGSNHRGELSCAYRHIEAAARAGATAVKFQFWTSPAHLESRPEMQRQLAPYTLRPDWLPLLRDCALENGLQFIVTPFDFDAIRTLRETCLPDMVKIAAYDLTYDDLILAAAQLGKPMVLSTAMATGHEVRHAVELTAVAVPLILLHGVAAYPAQEEDYNLAVLQGDDLYSWGISDHTRGILVPELATALGARMIEKHFRLIGVDDTPDAPHSLTPLIFREMVDAIWHVKAVLGSGKKKGPLPCEMELFTTCRRSNAKPLRG